MSQSNVHTAPNLDILTETVTDTRAAAPSATAQMQAILGELDKAAARDAFCCGWIITGVTGSGKYTAVVCHTNGRFRKTLIPPRDNEGRIASGGCQRDAPALYKLMVRLGLIQVTDPTTKDRGLLKKIRKPEVTRPRKETFVTDTKELNRHRQISPQFDALRLTFKPSCGIGTVTSVKTLGYLGREEVETACWLQTIPNALPRKGE